MKKLRKFQYRVKHSLFKKTCTVEGSKMQLKTALAIRGIFSYKTKWIMWKNMYDTSFVKCQTISLIHDKFVRT